MKRIALASKDHMQLNLVNLVHFATRNPDGGVVGTDLRLEYVEEQIIDDMVDLSAGVYDPRHPIYLATVQKPTNIQIQTGNQGNGVQYGEDYEEEHDIHDVLWVSPSDPWVIYDDEPSSFQSEYDEDEEEEWEEDPEYEEHEYDEYEEYDEEGYPYEVNYVGEPGIEDVAREEFKSTFTLFSELTDCDLETEDKRKPFKFICPITRHDSEVNQKEG